METEFPLLSKYLREIFNIYMFDGNLISHITFRPINSSTYSVLKIDVLSEFLEEANIEEIMCIFIHFNKSPSENMKHDMTNTSTLKIYPFPRSGIDGHEIYGKDNFNKMLELSKITRKVLDNSKLDTPKKLLDDLQKHYLLHLNLNDIRENITKFNKKQREMLDILIKEIYKLKYGYMEKIEELKTHLMYAPPPITGGEGYREKKENFELLQEKQSKNMNNKKKIYVRKN